MDIEAVKANQVWAKRGTKHLSANHEITQAVGTDLPDAIELIEEAEDLLLDARPVVGGEREAAWCKRREAFFAKIRPQTKQKGT